MSSECSKKRDRGASGGENLCSASPLERGSEVTRWMQRGSDGGWTEMPRIMQRGRTEGRTEMTAEMVRGRTDAAGVGHGRIKKGSDSAVR